jgi:hypothetical protein
MIRRWLMGAAIVLVAALASADADEEREHERDGERHALASFLKSCGLHERDIYFDRALTLHGKENARLLLASGKTTQYLAALSEEGSYVYIRMPWRERGDLRDARVLDLAGDGRQALIIRYREHGSTGDTREVLGVWRLPSESHIRRVFTADADKSVRFIRRGRANDLLIGSARYQFSGDQYRRLQ